MIGKQDEAPFFKALGAAIKEHVADAARGIVTRLEELETKLRSLPVPEKGEKGDRGDPGPAGVDGITPSSDLIREMVIQETRRCIASIPHPKDGARGEPGPQGPPGESVAPDVHMIRTIIGQEVVKAVAALPVAKDGAPGKDGESVHRDTVALMVLEEVRKAISDVPQPVTAQYIAPEPIPGPPGPPGPPGQSGRDGRDAVQIDILPAVDLARSYSRGTVARHDGGLIRAFRDTADRLPGEPLEASGWEVVVRGISSFETIAGDDPRAFKVRSCLTGGQIFEKVFRIPAMVYRGVFKGGEAYEPGDVVTWDGSAWHCQTQTKEAPGKSDAWKLMVKTGRPGKDGKDGERGQKGDKGDRGQDLTQMDASGRKW